MYLVDGDDKLRLLHASQCWIAPEMPTAMYSSGATTYRGGIELHDIEKKLGKTTDLSCLADLQRIVGVSGIHGGSRCADR